MTDTLLNSHNIHIVVTRVEKNQKCHDNRNSIGTSILLTVSFKMMKFVILHQVTYVCQIRCIVTDRFSSYMTAGTILFEGKKSCQDSIRNRVHVELDWVVSKDCRLRRQSKNDQPHT